jgi:hypothetical protein
MLSQHTRRGLILVRQKRGSARDNSGIERILTNEVRGADDK